MTYSEFIENKIRGYGSGEPIYIGAIAKEMATEFHLSAKDAAAAVSVAVKRMMDSKAIDDLRFFQKGIYYRTKMTPFGEIGIHKDTLIADKYLAEDNGYETGLALLHHMGLTTQIPAERMFATNKAKNCVRVDRTLGIYICPPKVKIDSKNKSYLQTLDAIDAMHKAPVDADHPYQMLAGHIQDNGLDYGELLSLADRYYNKNTVFTLAHIAGERNLNESSLG